jgi:diaminopimelate epimerase
MGKAVIEKETIIQLPQLSIKGRLVNVGNYHFISFDEALFDQPAEIYRAIEHHEAFPMKPNVESIQILSKNEINMKVWERGSGFTLACGSGSCASAFVAHKIRGLSSEIKVNNPGGDMLISILEDDSCEMSGTVSRVFQTSINIK